MRSCISMAIVAPFLLTADEPTRNPKHAPASAGWSFATEGSGIPRNQDAGGFAAGVDREVAHGGQASVSIRSIVAEPKHFRAVTQLIKADAYRGKRVRLAGYLKTRDVRGGWAGLWLRVDGPDAKLLAIDNMAAQRVMGTTDWSRHAVVLDVPEAAVRLAFGALLHGTGQVWADDLTLEVVDPQEVTVTSKGVEPITHAERAANLDFEATGAGATDAIPGWKTGGFDSGSFSRRIVEGEPTAAGRSWRSRRRRRRDRRGSSSSRILPRAPTGGNACGSGRISRPRTWSIRPTCGCARTRRPGRASSARGAGGRRGRPTGAPRKWSSTWPTTQGD